MFSRLFIISCLLLFLLVACVPSNSSQSLVYIDLNNLESLPTPQKKEVRPLRVAIAAVISPQGSAESYAPLLDYISQELNRPVERVQRRTYTEVNELIRTGEVDLAFVCTSSYLVGKKQFGMQLLAAPQVNGEVVYNAEIIVPADSSAKSLEDLRGKVFAYTDPISFTGRMYPTYLLQKAGEDPEEYFARTFFTYSHDDAINAVAAGLADGASVDKLVLDYAIKRDPALAEKIQVIHTSPPFGMPPVVVNPDIRPQLKAQLTDILLNTHLDPDGKYALQDLDYDRFVVVSAEDYQSAEAIESAVQCCQPEGK
ncbi:MAG: putative phosphite transport system-binding protein PtxB [Chloroflexi bacterium]|nr:putative phosphite transport system-binding protein PtxB [Chloroflexota bacterium]